MSLLACMTSLFALLATAYANTEKAIFVSPPAVAFPSTGPTFDTLQLATLTPDKPSVRLSLPVAFSTKDLPHGPESWYLLRGLNANQRHEVRVCWIAVQPTSFWLDTYDTTTVFDTPELIQSLANYSENRQGGSTQPQPSLGTAGSEVQESLLFLRVQAAADFFTSNKTLMQYPPPVDIDLILDPYLANIFPRSLVPTAGYILLLAVGGWYVSGIIWKRFFSGDAKPHQD